MAFPSIRKEGIHLPPCPHPRESQAAPERGVSGWRRHHVSLWGVACACLPVVGGGALSAAQVSRAGGGRRVF